VLPLETTALAEEQSHRLKPTLRRFDIIFLIVAAVIALDTLAQVSTFGGETFTWAVIIALTFLVPYALVFAEVGSAFPQEGGPYVWVRLAFGRFWAAISTIFYWVTNPVWVGGSLVFIATDTWNGFLTPLGEGTLADHAFKLIFIWATILTAIMSLRVGKWVTTAGAFAKLFVVAVFVVTAALYAAQHGAAGFAAGSFSPTLAGFLGVTPLLLFAFVGFEAPSGAAEEMKNPQRDVPVSVGVSSAIAAACYLVPIFAILAVVPADKVTGIGGFMDAVATVFSVYGAAGPVLLDVVALAFVFALLNQGSAWMMVCDRIQAIAAADGAFFGGYFGEFSKRLGTPVRINLLSGVLATAFMLAAMTFVSGSSAAIFGVVLTIAITTLLISYLLILPATMRLATKHAHVRRPYRVPGGATGLRVMASVCLAWIALGSWVAVFPGTLEHLVGIEYDFAETWGVSQAQFEIFTVGTLVGLVVFAAVGYAGGRRLRSRNGQPGVGAPRPALEEALAA
jgi:glutamate:GABA antiporter